MPQVGKKSCIYVPPLYEYTQHIYLVYTHNYNNNYNILCLQHHQAGNYQYVHASSTVYVDHVAVYIAICIHTYISGGECGP